MNWWLQLDKTRGSRPRCVALMDGPREIIADRLTRLIGLPDAAVSPGDKWMPRGRPMQRLDGTWDMTPAEEAKLSEPNDMIPPPEQEQLKTWWLAHTGKANIPNWDIASTCRIEGIGGLLLIEAKAHDEELRGEEGGKTLNTEASKNSFANHLQIGRAIADSAAYLQRATQLPCAVSRDNRYQMSNRFASACKLAELGYPVILVYLGFLNAHEMADQGQLLRTPEQWQDLVKSHSAPLFPPAVWNQRWKLHGQPFAPLIRSLDWHIVPEARP